MVEFDNIRLFRDFEKEDKRVKFDIELISFNNAILYSVFNDDYCKHTNSPKIRNGLVLYNGLYYFFEQSLTDDHNLYRVNQYSYYVYNVRNELALKIMDSKMYDHWMVRFESLYYYGCFYKVMNTYYNMQFIYESKIVGDEMYIPNGQSPASLRNGVTMKEFFIDHYNKYGIKGSELLVNNVVLRRNKIKSLELNG